ncbi:MAG: FtsQ-type POTRA domain-containing protein [Kiritimatiellaeota bacterium]|nr:FtsQ-type POTRA domain-containing protein [Kiritimatiellota bacterium]
MGTINDNKPARRRTNERVKPGSAPRKAAKWRPPRWAPAALAVAAAATTAATGAWAHYHYHLCRDSRYALRHLDIEGGVIYPAEKLRDLLQLEEGKNIFTACDFAKKRGLLLENGFTVKGISMTRQLPDRLVVRVEEREPVALLAGGNELLVDGGGLLFAGGWPTLLPVVTGHGETEAKPGARLTGMGLEAALLARVLRASDFGMPFVEGIDAAQEDFLIVTLAGARKILLAWEGMGRGDAEKALRAQLRAVAGLVNNVPAGRRFDARSHGKIYVQQ